MGLIDLVHERDEVANSSEHSNEHYCCINCMEFLLQLRNYQLLKNDFAKWG
jgi:hypothetical protein